MKTELTEKGKRDKRLIEAALAGSQSAYAELLDGYHDSIYFLVLKMVHDKREAEDLVMEVFGKAFLRLDQYTSKYAFSTWLYRIASNHCIDFIRKKRMKTLSLDQEDDQGSNQWSMEVKAEGKNPEQAFMHQQKLAKMRSAVNNLKSPYRELVSLRYFDEYSYEEIAEECNLPLGTVKAQLFRARALLNDMLGDTKDTF
jgi:RNA polymerase sigma-70 factor (ECF subfamily)